MLKLRGVLCPLATPFDHRGELYPTKIRHNVGRLNLTSSSGYVVASRTGERELLSAAERRRLWQEVKQAAGDGKLVIAGAGAAGVHETLQLAAEAREDGCDAVWIAPPGLFEHDANAALLYFRAVADGSKLPVVVGEARADDASIERLSKLTAHPNIVAACCDADDERFMRLREAVPEGLPLLSGAERGLAERLRGAAQAAVVPLANVLPFHLLSLEEAVRTREHEAAADLEARLAPALEAIERHGVAGLKHAMDLRGMYGGPPRLPLSPLGPAAKAEIEAALDGLAS